MQAQPQSTDARRARVIEIAESYIGATDATPFWAECGHDAERHPQLLGLSWCGVFALACLRQAELTNRKWVMGRGFIYVDDDGAPAKKPYIPLIRRSAVQVSDVLYWNQPYQHYALAARIECDDDGDPVVIHTIAGNVWKAVARSKVLNPAKASGMSVFSIGPLIAAESQMKLFQEAP